MAPVGSLCPADQMEAVAILLAAGRGDRFGGGTHKLLTPVDAVPIVVRAVTAPLDAGFTDVIVVVGAVPLVDVLGEWGLSNRVQLVRNPHWRAGLATSLQAGLARAAELGHHTAVVGLGDMPDVTPQDWISVTEETATPITVVRWSRGHRSPPVRLHADLWSRLPVAGDVGVRTLWEADPKLVTEVARAGSGRDIDTMDDLEVE